jgi:hypothetical protein
MSKKEENGWMGWFILPKPDHLGERLSERGAALSSLI